MSRKMLPAALEQGFKPYLLQVDQSSTIGPRVWLVGCIVVPNKPKHQRAYWLGNPQCRSSDRIEPYIQISERHDK